MISSDFWLFELSIWLHVFARSLVTIFIPIFILQAGYDVTLVIVYYLVYNAVDVPLNFFARFLVRRIGARWVIALGTLFSICFFLILRILGAGDTAMLFVLAGVAAFYDAFYWVAHLYLFIESDRGHTDAGKSTGVLYAVKTAAGFIGPALGAGVVLLFSESALIWVSIIVFVLSLAPLIYVNDFSDKPKVPQRSFRDFFSNWKEKRNYLLTSLYSLHGSAEGVLWPLFIFIIFGNLGSVALVPIIISLTAILFSYITGKIAKNERDWIISLGAVLIALIWILRIFFQTTFFLYGSIFLVGFFSLFVGIPIDSNIFTRAKSVDALDASTYRNAFSMFSKFLLYSFLALIIGVFKVSFVVAAISMFALLAVNYFFLKRYSGVLVFDK
jgi:MFS family permease